MSDLGLKEKNNGIVVVDSLMSQNKILSQVSRSLPTIDMVSHIECSDVKFYVTYRHDSIKWMTGNRDIVVSHLKRLKCKIRLMDLSKYNPIIVFVRDGVMYCFDGQHRLKSWTELTQEAKKQGLDKVYPVYYVVMDITKPDGTLKSDRELLLELQEMQTKKGWSKEAHLHSYSDLDLENYVFLKSYLKEHPHLKVSDAIQLFDNTRAGKVVLDSFADGNFKLDNKENAEMIVDILEYMDNFTDNKITGKIFTKAMTTAFKSLVLNNPHFDEDTFRKRFNNNFEKLTELVNKVDKKSGKKGMVSHVDYKYVIKDIYNTKTRKDKQLIWG